MSAKPSLPEGRAHAHCDILIVGAGPAGMAAALAAAPSGAAIVVLDDNPAPGGQIWRDGPGVHLPKAAYAMRERLARHANVRLLCGARVVGLGAMPGEHALLIEDADRGWIQTWQRLILCTGARELLLPFPGWTLPGVTGAGGLQALIKAGLPVAGQRIVIAGSGPLLLAAANTAKKAGARVLRVAEQAHWRHVARFAAQLPRWSGKLGQAVGLLTTRYRPGTYVTQAHGAGRVESVTLRSHDGEHTMPCDRLACGYGLVPNTQLGELLGCAKGDRLGLAVDTSMRTTTASIYAAGECTGFGGSERALLQGHIAGNAATGKAGIEPAHREKLSHWQGFADALHRDFILRPELKSLALPDTVVCRCEDVSYAQVAARDGWIDAKLHVRCGMGACQGRVCGAAVQALFGWEPAPARHLLAPVRLDTLAAEATVVEDTPC